jgi:hypothetical protein
MNVDAPLTYSGRTALRREKCGVFVLAENVEPQKPRGTRATGKLRIESARF